MNKLEQATNLLLTAQNPLILARGGAIYSDAGKLICEIAEILACPIATSLKGKGIISEDHPLCLGCVGITGQKAANEHIKKVDVLFAIGISFHQFTTRSWTFPSKKTKIIRIDVLDKDITKNYKEEILIKGDIKKSLEELKDFLEHKEIKRSIKKRELMRKIRLYKNIGYFDYPEMYSRSFPLKPQTFVAELRKYLPRNSILCTESIAWTEKYFKTFEPRTYIVSTGLAPIGCSLSEALGAKLAFPNRVVVSIQGDGGFQMSGMELMTAVNYKIPIIAIVLNNSILGPIFHTQKKKYGKTFCSEFINPDYIKMAESFGVVGLKIKYKKEIKDTITKALKINKKGKPVLIDVSRKEVWP